MKSVSVRRSRSYLAVAVAFLAAAAAVFLLLRGLVRFIGAGLLLIAALGFLLSWLVCTVCYSEEDKKDFTVKTFFGKRRTVAYCDLWGIYKNRLYLPKGSIVLAKGKQTEQFLEFANRRYQSTHGKRIPNVVKIKRSYDPMNGNVYEPWSYIVILGICFCISLAILIAEALKTHSNIVAIIVFGFSTFFFGCMLEMLIYVGRNADILPRWLVECFYKPDALTFQTDQYQGKKLK